MLATKEYLIQPGHQVLKVGDHIHWIHKPNCNVLLKTDGDAFDLEVLLAEHQHPEYTYVSTLHVEDSKFYLQYK